MKRLLEAFFMLVALFWGVSGYAQTNRSFRKGYRGNVEVGNYAAFGKGEVDGRVLLSSTHGYSMGNGMFIGAGVGYGYEIASDLYLVSAFLESKYNLLDTTVSPFLDVRTGFDFAGGKEQVSGQFVALSCGVDVQRLSVKVGYEYCPIRQQDVQRVVTFRKPSFLFCAFAINF